LFLSSRISYFLCSCLLVYASFSFYPKWEKSGGEALISWDVYGYYSYLPAIFIYKDIKKQVFLDTIVKKYHPADDHKPGYASKNGNWVMKYSSGMAVVYLPFFTAANLLAKPLGYPQDGFSLPYQFFIQLGGVLFALIGLWYFRKLLLLFYNDIVVATCMLLLAFGTNYLDYSAIDVGMSHSWLFTIYVFLVLNTVYFYQNYQYKYAIRIGLLIGLATLIRPTEIIAVLIPLLWGIVHISKISIKQRLWVLYTHRKKMFVAFLCAFVIISIQLIYWKYITGNWLVYSYEDQGFSFKSPHIIEYTFSFDSGWLVYTPIMIFAFIGIIPFLRSGKNKLAILSFFIINYYIICAWNQWWYGGRAMVQSYPILFFPIASFLNTVLQRKYLLWIVTPIAIVFTYFNLWYIYQCHTIGFIVPNDYMTNVYFWKVAGRWHVPNDVNKLRYNTDYFEGIPQNLQLLYSNDFEKDTVYCPFPPVDGKVSLYLDKDHQSTAVYRFPYSIDHANWVRAEATFLTINKEWTPWLMPQFIVRFYKGNDIVKERLIRISRFIETGKTKNIYIDVKIPKENFDSIGILFLNSDSQKQVLIDNLKVWSFN